MLNYPDKISFGGVEFGFMMYDEVLKYPGTGERLNAVTLMDQNMIMVWNNPNAPLSTEEAGIHEILEAIINVYDLRFEDPITGNTYQMPHSAIKTMGVALHQALSTAKLDFGQSAMHMNTTTH